MLRLIVPILLLAVGALDIKALDWPNGSFAFLEKHCFECHDEDTQKGELDLTLLSPGMASREEAEDMLQEAFADAFASLHRFRGESTFGAWLKRIVINKCINELKRRKVDLELRDDIGRFEGAHEDTSHHKDLQLEVARVMEAVKQLPDGYRVIFSLYLLEGYDHREIAEILEITESTSKSQYMRAKKKIKQLLTGS